MNKYTKNLIYIFSFLFASYSFAAEPAKDTVIIVSADWCTYCHKAKNDINTDPKLSEVIKSYNVILIDYDVDKDFVSGYNIKTLPTFLVLKNDKKETKRKVGYKNSNDLVKFLQDK